MYILGVYAHYAHYVCVDGCFGGTAEMFNALASLWSLNSASPRHPAAIPAQLPGLPLTYPLSHALVVLPQWSPQSPSLS